MDPSTETTNSRRSLVLGHGRKHRILTSVNYQHSTFVDRDPTCQPDILVDVRLNPLKANTLFDEACFVCSATMMLRRGRYLDLELLTTIYDSLKVDGELFVNNIYKMFPNDQAEE